MLPNFTTFPISCDLGLFLLSFLTKTSECYVQKFSSYLTKNSLFPLEKSRWLMLNREKVAVFRENHVAYKLWVRNEKSLVFNWWDIELSLGFNPFTDEAQTALFKDPVRTAP